MATIKEILEGNVTQQSESEPEAVETVEQPETEAPEVEATSDEPVEAEERGDKQVPLAALQAERGKVKRYTEQVADFEKRLAEQDAKWQQRIEQLLEAQKPKEAPAPAPNFWENPESAIDYRLQQMVSPLHEQMVRQREELSQMQAVATHGQETVEKAFSELRSRVQQNPQVMQATYQQIMASPHPYGALVDWHKRQAVIDEIGTDPNAYKEKLRAELMAEMQSAQPQRAPMPVNMPGNFATARNTGSRSAPEWGGPSSIKDLLGR